MQVIIFRICGLTSLDLTPYTQHYIHYSCLTRLGRRLITHLKILIMIYLANNYFQAKEKPNALALKFWCFVYFYTELFFLNGNRKVLHGLADTALISNILDIFGVRDFFFMFKRYYSWGLDFILDPRKHESMSNYLFISLPVLMYVCVYLICSQFDFIFLKWDRHVQKGRYKKTPANRCKRRIK